MGRVAVQALCLLAVLMAAGGAALLLRYDRQAGGCSGSWSCETASAEVYPDGALVAAFDGGEGGSQETTLAHAAREAHPRWACVDGRLRFGGHACRRERGYRLWSWVKILATRREEYDGY